MSGIGKKVRRDGGAEQRRRKAEIVSHLEIVIPSKHLPSAAVRPCAALVALLIYNTQAVNDDVSGSLAGNSRYHDVKQKDHSFSVHS
ncbi:MAG: hypothetical protein BroJett003_15500 [Planctomycetota bacterium]|nr:MAG: hypothetical protein BroJett003_15500 [Planctomycetota bacterium]